MRRRLLTCDVLLSRIQTLYMDRNLSLWGIPYKMRKDIGQAPRHIQDAGNTKGWIYLCNPGWFGNRTDEDVKEIKAYLERVAEFLPHNAFEWCEVS